MRFLTAAAIVGVSYASGFEHNRTQPLSFIEACPEITARCNVPTAPTAPSDEIARALECLQQTDLATIPAGPCHGALAAILGKFNQVPVAQASPEMLQRVSIALNVPVSVRLGSSRHEPGQVRGGKRSFSNDRHRRRPIVMHRRPASENRTKPERVRRNGTSFTDFRNRTSVFDRMRRSSRGRADSADNSTEGKSMFRFKAHEKKKDDDERRSTGRKSQDSKSKEDHKFKKDDSKSKKDGDRRPKKDDDRKSKDGDRKSKDSDRKSKDGDRKSKDSDRKSKDSDRKSKDGDRKSKDFDRKSHDANKPRAPTEGSRKSVLHNLQRRRFAKQNRTHAVRVGDESATVGNDVPEQIQQVEETSVQTEEAPSQTEQPTTASNLDVAPSSNVEIAPASFA